MVSWFTSKKVRECIYSKFQKVKISLFVRNIKDKSIISSKLSVKLIILLLQISRLQKNEGEVRELKQEKYKMIDTSTCMWLFPFKIIENTRFA